MASLGFQSIATGVESWSMQAPIREPDLVVSENIMLRLRETKKSRCQTLLSLLFGTFMNGSSRVLRGQGVSYVVALFINVSFH